MPIHLYLQSLSFSLKRQISSFNLVKYTPHRGIHPSIPFLYQFVLFSVMWDVCGLQTYKVHPLAQDMLPKL